VIANLPHDVQTLERSKRRIRGNEVCIWRAAARTYRPVCICNSRIVIAFTVCPMCHIGNEPSIHIAQPAL
jgi:hypothetical protein